jgi:hypothetical protein
MADVFDLLAAREPLPRVKFPNGKVFAVRESDGFFEQLLEEAAAEKSGEKFTRAWRYIVPDATPKDWASLTTQDYARLLTHARQNVIKTLEFVEASRKNGSGGTREIVSGIPPSNPTAASSPSSPESPALSDATGSSSAENPTGKRSSRSTGSRKSSGSTDSSPTSTP